MQETADYIRTLNPKPGSAFGGALQTRYVVPDIHVEKVENRYVVLLNDSLSPRLRISSYYQQLFKSRATDEELSLYIKTTSTRPPGSCAASNSAVLPYIGSPSRL